MKYHGFYLKKIIDSDVIGGSYYEIYQPQPNGTFKFITTAWTLSNAKEFIDSGLNYGVLA